MEGDMGHMGGLINPAPGADNTEPVFQIPVGLPSLKRGRSVKKQETTSFGSSHRTSPRYSTTFIRNQTCTVQLMYESKDSLFYSYIFPRFSSRWSTRGHIRRSAKNSNPDMTLSESGARGCLDHRLRILPTYTAQLLSLHQQRTNNQYRTANQS